MAQAKTIPIARHAFADGSLKQMLIDGKRVDAASGKHSESRNPATLSGRAWLRYLLIVGALANPGFFRERDRERRVPAIGEFARSRPG
jgi:hypothetical protein